MNDVFQRAKDSHRNRVLFGTDGFVGFGPGGIQFWDGIWMVEGCRTYMVLRDLGDIGGVKAALVVGNCFYYAPESVLGVEFLRPSESWQVIDLTHSRRPRNDHFTVVNPPKQAV